MKKFFIIILSFFIYFTSTSKQIKFIDNIKEESNNTPYLVYSKNKLIINPKNEYTKRLYLNSSNDLDFDDFNLIDDYEYFTNLNSYPRNYDGSCGFVALSMVLGYLHNYYEPILKKEFIYKNGTNQHLHDTLTDYGHYIFNPFYKEQRAATAKYIRDTYADFEREHIDLKYMYGLFMIHSDGPLLGDNISKENIKFYLDHNIPVILVMRKFSYREFGSKKIEQGSWHNVVVYGYKDDLFVAHLGWHSDPNYVILDASVIQSYIAIGEIKKISSLN